MPGDSRWATCPCFSCSPLAVPPPCGSVLWTQSPFVRLLMSVSPASSFNCHSREKTLWTAWPSPSFREGCCAGPEKGGTILSNPHSGGLQVARVGSREAGLSWKCPEKSEGWLDTRGRGLCVWTSLCQGWCLGDVTGTHILLPQSVLEALCPSR